MKCECGCGKETTIVQEADRRRGLVKGQSRRFIQGHNTAADPLERFAQKFDVALGGCWQWRAGMTSHGYGVFSLGGKLTMAHRFSYEAHVGPIPAGLSIDHLCRNTACVNPEHLEPVPIAENIRRGNSLSARRRRQTTCKNGHAFDFVTGQGRRRCTQCHNARRRARYRKATQ